MARRNYKINELDPVLGGVDFDSSPFTISKDCLIDVNNMLPSTSVGGLAVRNGIKKHNSIAINSNIVGLASFYDLGAVNEFFLAQAGSKLYLNNPEGTWSNITGALTFTDSPNNLMSFDILNNTIYAANRMNNQMWSWPRTGNGTVIAHPPAGGAQFVTMFQRRIFAGGGSSSPVIVPFSAIDDGTDYTSSTGWLNFDEGSGSKVTGFARTALGSFAVFKDKSISMVDATGGTPAFTKYVFFDGVGCVSHQSIVNIPGGSIMFWDQDDIYILYGNTVQSASVHPKTKHPRLRNFFRNMVNPARLQYVTGVYYPPLDIVRWFYSSAGSNTNNAHIDYHVKTRSFWPGTLRGTSCCIRNVLGQTRIYAGDTNGFVYRQDYQTNDDGSGINWNARTAWQYFEGATIKKKLDLIYAILEKQSNFEVLVDIFFDQANVASILNAVLSTASLSGATWDTAMFETDSFPSEGALLEATYLVNQLFKSVSINIYGTNLDTPVNIHKIVFTERPLEFTRGDI